jgi:hypothetical protein
MRVSLIIFDASYDNLGSYFKFRGLYNFVSGLAGLSNPLFVSWRSRSSSSSLYTEAYGLFSALTGVFKPSLIF